MYSSAAVLSVVALGLAGGGDDDDGGNDTASALTRLASVPLGAEITGMFLNDEGDMFFNVQHPSSANVAPNDLATVGVIAGANLHDLPENFTESPVPTTALEKQSVMTAVGQYQPLGQEGQTFGGDLPFGLGAIVAADGVTRVALSDDPDFNAYLPDATAAAGETRGYLFSNWEYRPGGMSRLHIEKDSGSGGWRVLEALNIDFSAVQGTWVNCFGTLSPWGTPLTSEELYFDDTSIWNDGTDSGVQNLAAYLGYPTDGTGAWPNPYRYGYIVEITNPGEAAPAPVKLFALGRYSHENAVVMPDRRTVYLSDDGGNVVFFKFVADTADDLSAGTLYAAQVTQDAGVTDPAEAGFDITWIELAHGDAATIETWITEYDGVTVAGYADGGSSYISDADVCAWAEDKAGVDLACDATGGVATDDRAAFLESRKAAAALGATAEFNKMEGVNINYAGAADGSIPYMYMAMSDVSGGMSDGAGDIAVDANRCGVVYRMEFVDAAGGDYDVTRMEPAVAGGPYDAALTVNQCSVDNISNPDNLLVMNDGRVMIGEDTSRHENNMLWVWNPAAAE
ncbi:MAG: DUF839 domain-containing protein [Chromatiales bacterium]|nr:DUF839 domain-containing protein [Chromatiales bacterium]